MSHDTFPVTHEVEPLAFEVVKLTDGLGFGHGKISAESVEAAEGNEDLAVLTDEALHSPRIMAPISRDDDGEIIRDDGCGDGRRTGLVFDGERVRKSSLLRSKVFGGGIMMAASARIGLGIAGDQSIMDTITDSDAQLSERGIEYGGHTVELVAGRKSGCGAIDESPAILAAAGTYRDEIRSTAVMLLGNETDVDEVIDNFVEAGATGADGYSGADVMAGIIDRGKVVKALADDHLETRIVLNFVPGYTADQSFVRDYTGGRAQVFSVDVWRMAELAERLYDNPADQRRALVSELVYTLATASVLTKGDLPVYAIQSPVDEPAYS